MQTHILGEHTCSEWSHALLQVPVEMIFSHWVYIHFLSGNISVFNNAAVSLLILFTLPRGNVLQTDSNHEYYWRQCKEEMNTTWAGQGLFTPEPWGTTGCMQSCRKMECVVNITLSWVIAISIQSCLVTAVSGVRLTRGKFSGLCFSMRSD